MSCIDVLYQPYASQPFSGKYSASRSQQRPGYIYDRHSSTSSDSGSICERSSLSLLPFHLPQNSCSGQNLYSSGNTSASRSTSSSSIYDISSSESERKYSEQTHQQVKENSSQVFAHRSVSTTTTGKSSCAFDQRKTTAPGLDSTDVNALVMDAKSGCSASDLATSNQSSRISPFLPLSEIDERKSSHLQQSPEPCPNDAVTESGSATCSTSTVGSSSCRPSCRLNPPGQRVSPRCVMFNYFNGTTSDEVDVHFNRALSHDCNSQSRTSGGSPPMSKRRFPPSFWDSEYKQPRQSKINFSGNDCARNLTFPFATSSSFSSLLPGHQALIPFGHTANHQFYSFDRLSSTFDPYSSSCSFGGLQNNLQQALSAAAVAEVANNAMGNPWNNYAGLSSSLSGQNSYTHRAANAAAAAAVPDLRGFSATSSYALNQRYNSLLLQPSTGASLAANLPFHSSNFGKGQTSIWPVQRYPGFRF